MKNKLSVAPVIAGLLAGAAAVSAATPAAAQDAGPPSCDTYPNPVIISGSSASQPILQALSATLAADGVPISIIYASPDSCLGVGDFVAGITTPGSIGNESSSEYLPPGTAGSPTFPSPVACTLGTNDVVDIAVSDVFPATCVANTQGLTIPSSVVTIPGPIQAMTIVVPSGSSASVINAAAAQVVFGYDAATYSVSPWTAAGGIFTRPYTSGTLNMIGTAIGLTPANWANAENTASAQYAKKTSNMTTDLTMETAGASATIGILSAEAVAVYNAGAPAVPLDILHFQATDQDCGYLPDSAGNKLDKINVRQGRYAIWGPLHLLANTNSSGQTTGAHAAEIATVLNYFIATGPTPTTSTLFTGALSGDAGAGVSTNDIQQLITAESKPAYVVPWCAMEAQRSTEVGPESSYASPEPCSCLFEETVQGAPVSGHTCTACGGDAGACPGTQVCRYGYCEVQ